MKRDLAISEKGQKIINQIVSMCQNITLNDNGELNCNGEEDKVVKEFAKLLNDFPNFDFVLFMRDYLEVEEIQSVLSKLLNLSIPTLANKINGLEFYNMRILNSAFADSADVDFEGIFGGRIEEFYRALDNDNFEFFEIFFNSRNLLHVTLSREFEDELMQFLNNCIENNTAKPEDLWRFLNRYIYRHNYKFTDEQLDNIAQITPRPIDTYQFFKYKGVDTTKLREVISTNKTLVVKELLGDFGAGISMEGVSQTSFETIWLMIDEIARYQGLDFTDIEELEGSEGSYSKVYRLGTKIIKIGNTLRTQNIPQNCKRFLQPLVRFEFDVKRDGEGSFDRITFQMMEECDRGTVSEEDLYNVYRDIRDCGMVWTDCAPRNLGRLRKPNVVYLPSIKRKGQDKTGVHHTNVGFAKEPKKLEILPAGEFVVLDLDYVFPEDKVEKIPNSARFFYERLEARYQEELKKRKEVKKNTIEIE